MSDILDRLSAIMESAFQLMHFPYDGEHLKIEAAAILPNRERVTVEVEIQRGCLLMYFHHYGTEFEMSRTYTDMQDRLVDCKQVKGNRTITEQDFDNNCGNTLQELCDEG